MSVDSTTLSLVWVGLREGPDGVQVLNSNCSTEVWIVDVAMETKFPIRYCTRSDSRERADEECRVSDFVEVYNFLSHRNAKSGVYTRPSQLRKFRGRGDRGVSYLVPSKDTSTRRTKSAAAPYRARRAFLTNILIQTGSST